MNGRPTKDRLLWLPVPLGQSPRRSQILNNYLQRIISGIPDCNSTRDRVFTQISIPYECPIVKHFVRTRPPDRYTILRPIIQRSPSSMRRTEEGARRSGHLTDNIIQNFSPPSCRKTDNILGQVQATISQLINPQTTVAERNELAIRSYYPMVRLCCEQLPH